jgi:hypothetical protein
MTFSVEPKIKTCNRPGCRVLIRPGQLACGEHWAELGKDLQDRLVFTWEQRKAHPDVPELVHAHRALLLEALRKWGIPDEIIQAAIQRSPRAASQSCPFCGALQPFHRPGCRFYPEET